MEESKKCCATCGNFDRKNATCKVDNESVDIYCGCNENYVKEE